MEYKRNITQNYFYKFILEKHEMFPDDIENLEIIAHIRPSESIIENDKTTLKVNVLFYDINTKELLYKSYFFMDYYKFFMFNRVERLVEEHLEEHMIFDYYNYKLDCYEETKRNQTSGT